MFNLNGWQRIGVVLSFIYIIVMSYAIYDAIERNNKKLTYSTETDVIIKTINEKIEHCIDTKAYYRKRRLERDRRVETKKSYKEGMEKIESECRSKKFAPTYKKIHHIKYLSSLAYLFSPLVLIWIMAYAIVYIVRWIMEGFKK